MAKPRHFLKLNDLSPEEIQYLFDRTRVLKRRFKSYEKNTSLQDRTLVMIFEKNSTRTRLSFEAGINQMGGNSVYLNTKDSQLGRGEPVEDSARVISRMCDLVMIRTYEQSMIEKFAQYSTVPVINGLTDDYHPCQILADIFTFIEHVGPIKGKTVSWIGDANNMCNSWIQAAELLDFTLQISSPPDFSLKNRESLAKNVRVFEAPTEAVSNSNLVTTDVWTSMGFEEEQRERKAAFENWQVNEKLMRLAAPNALFMHCLPAHRGEEVTSGVIDSPQSVVWDEAENRLHTQKALMEFLLFGEVRD
jgi:ornithine carbamoyltransferase